MTSSSNLQSAPLQQNSDFKAWFRSGSIRVDIYPRRGDGYIDLALRFSRRPKDWQKLKSWNRNRRYPEVGRPIQVPFTYLNAASRLLVVNRIFKRDRYQEPNWQHYVTFRGETMWFIAEVFTGDGNNYHKIQKANNITAKQKIGVGQRILIPKTLLSAEFIDQSSQVVAASPVPTRRSGSSKETVTRFAKLPDHPELSFEKDANGNQFAVYRLKGGEALYSSVVVRFTGRIEADDVNEMAGKIMKVNGISDPTKIPTGKRIRIPFEYLSEDFDSGGAPDRLVAVNRSRGRAKAHVILDPGHGGADPGTIRSGQTEDELAYDVMVRLKRTLERRGAKVYTTVYDPVDKERPRNISKLKNGKSERVKTTPNYRISNARTSVNMRVYLVNNIYDRLKRQGVKDRDIFFISIHMDHLHPRLSGSMIYYPRARERTNSFKASGRIYGRYQESKGSRIHFSKSANRQAESFSYDFSREMTRVFRKRGIPIHSYRPIRPFVYRKNKKWTPAIIRYNKVPTAILLEVANMANSSDFRRLRDYRFRQKVAEAIAETIL